LRPHSACRTSTCAPVTTSIPCGSSNSCGPIPTSTSPRPVTEPWSLRERYGIEDASPFSYGTALSPFLNIYCEPPEYLTDAERQAFEPVAFFGSLPSPDTADADAGDGGPSPFGDAAGLKLYASFGTIAWRYYAREAIAALRAIAASVARRPHVSAIISLGGADIGAEARRALEAPNVCVASYVDQWRVLRHADAFVTHHGLNSTHEAVFHQVPMVSYPFFWDQPLLAQKCRHFGVAMPLTETLRGQVTEAGVDAILDDLARHPDPSRASLAEARRWELEVIAARGPVLGRIVDLA
jgi:UDP:flavonoid glycosyltransferase YjiC (YdhE family)